MRQVGDVSTTSIGIIISSGGPHNHLQIHIVVSKFIGSCHGLGGLQIITYLFEHGLPIPIPVIFPSLSQFDGLSVVVCVPTGSFKKERNKPQKKRTL